MPSQELLSSSSAMAKDGRAVLPARSTDTIGRLLEELCRPGALERRRDGERHLLDYVDAEARDLAPEVFSKFLSDLYKRVDALLKPGWGPLPESNPSYVAVHTAHC